MRRAVVEVRADAPEEAFVELSRPAGRPLDAHAELAVLFRCLDRLRHAISERLPLVLDDPARPVHDPEQRRSDHQRQGGHQEPCLHDGSPQRLPKHRGILIEFGHGDNAPVPGFADRTVDLEERQAGVPFLCAFVLVQFIQLRDDAAFERVLQACRHREAPTNQVLVLSVGNQPARLPELHR